MKRPLTNAQRQHRFRVRKDRSLREAEIEVAWLRTENKRLKAEIERLRAADAKPVLLLRVASAELGAPTRLTVRATASTRTGEIKGANDAMPYHGTAGVAERAQKLVSNGTIVGMPAKRKLSDAQVAEIKRRLLARSECRDRVGDVTLGPDRRRREVGARLAGLPPSRDTLHRSLRVPDLRTGVDSPCQARSVGQKLPSFSLVISFPPAR